MGDDAKITGDNHPQERVVYLLGAGFSAPLGLPVMNDFLIKAKDLYFREPEKYDHFRDVLQTIDRMHKAKSYYDVDLFDIEEILSILDMEDQVTSKDRSAQFAEFIKTVVTAYTPPIGEPTLPKHQLDLFKKLAGGFQSGLFASRGLVPGLITQYGFFVCTLYGLRLDVEHVSSNYGDGSHIQYSIMPQRKTQYDVVTLNYDLVIENYAKHILTYLNPMGSKTDLLNTITLSKLHGSVDASIVAPTWKKWAVGNLQDMWQKAYHCLSKATHIRILGYSLPVSDSYIRYLLEASALNSKHLKRIDIISLDDEQKTLQKRYASFIGFKYARFRNARIENYLDAGDDLSGFKNYCTQDRKHSEFGDTYFVEFNRFERFHDEFMDGHPLKCAP